MAAGGEGLAIVVRRIVGGIWHSLAGGVSPAGAGRHRALFDHARRPQRKLLRRLAPEREPRAGFRQLLSPRARVLISAANTAVMNVHAMLGFSFSAPEMIFHWHQDAFGRKDD